MCDYWSIVINFLLLQFFVFFFASFVTGDWVLALTPTALKVWLALSEEF